MTPEDEQIWKWVCQARKTTFTPPPRGREWAIGWEIKLATLAYQAGRVAQAEQDAKLCDEKVAAEYATGKVDHKEMGWTQACAISIRANAPKAGRTKVACNLVMSESSCQPESALKCKTCGSWADKPCAEGGRWVDNAPKGTT